MPRTVAHDEIARECVGLGDERRGAVPNCRHEGLAVLRANAVGATCTEDGNGVAHP